MDGYDEKSCDPLQKPFYRPVEAAIRWCGLIAHEGQILADLGVDGIPKTGQFPMWSCLQANTEKILDAIAHGDIPHGRDGKSVAPTDHVTPSRLTVRHTDLRQWIAKHYPADKPEFLFDEIERTTHPAINVDSFRTLQSDLVAKDIELDRAAELTKEMIDERDALLRERDSLWGHGRWRHDCDRAQYPANYHFGVMRPLEDQASRARRGPSDSQTNRAMRRAGLRRRGTGGVEKNSLCA